MKAFVYSVSQINNYIKGIIESDSLLSEVFIEAEISNFKAHTSGHFYFTLKDENAAISAVMYRSNSLKINFIPENGMKVLVYGYISLYEKTGQYQICVQIIEPSGKGALYAAFEQLKTKLETEGLFDKSHKKIIPKFPKCIAVITSSSGAAVRDIIKISKRRNPNVKVVVIPAVVQGETAPQSICDAIKTANKWKKADLIILGRGGGSIEDLWCFNTESVARAIYSSEVPIISAVGHETDFTIADFTADLRASTPSAAAEIAVPLKSDLLFYVKTAFEDITYCINLKITDEKKRLKNCLKEEVIKNPLVMTENKQSKLENIFIDLNAVIDCKLENRKIYLEKLINDTENLSPLAVLKRGFSLTYVGNNRKQTASFDEIINGDVIYTKMNGGTVKSLVAEKKENYNNI